MPKRAGRCSAGVTSLIYSLAVEKLAAVIPEITRPTNIQGSDGVSAINT